MANSILLIAILFAGTSYASFTAKRTAVFTEGGNWATNFCPSPHELCKYPYEMAYGRGADRAVAPGEVRVGNQKLSAPAIIVSRA